MSLVGHHLSALLSNGDVPIIITEFLDASSGLELSRTCTQIYCAIPRNSTVGVSIWRRYLSDNRYVSNRLVFEIGKQLVESENVSRSNYKLILSVLAQKNSFMKINRLKALLSDGKLANPILPHKGEWRCLTRIDQFALKRATQESQGAPRSNLVIPASTSATTGVKFISRLAGRKGRHEMVMKQLSTLLQNNSSEQLTELLSILVQEMNHAGLLEILEISSSILDGRTVDECLSRSIKGFQSAIGDTLLHTVVRDKNTSIEEKIRLMKGLLKYDGLKKLVNETNLNHESVLVLVGTLQPTDKRWSDIGNVLIGNGADLNICDKKGNFYVLSV